MNSGDVIDPVVQTVDLRKRYGSREVLQGVDLRINRGEVLALLGPNGAGKTTTIEILEGFRRRTGGEVRVLGADPERADEEWRARLGIVLQSWRDHGRWRVRELLEHLGRFYAPYGSPDRPRPYDPDELVQLVGLTDQANTPIAQLSGGRRRRLDVAVGLVGRPELLFLDEPTVGFDPMAREEFHEVVRRLSATGAITILLTTHDLDEAEKLCDRIVLMVGGRIVAQGTPAELAVRMAGKAEVRFTRNGRAYAESVGDPTGYVRQLFAEHGEAIGDLEVRRVRLAEVYLAMVRDFETGGTTEAPGALAEVSA